MENQSRISNGTTSDDVHIYLRNSQKRAHYIRIQKEIGHQDLRRIVSDRLKIPAETLLHFLKGEEIKVDQTVSLGDKNIVHVVNLNNAEKEMLNIHVKRLEGVKSLNHYQVRSNSKIIDFIDGQIL